MSVKTESRLELGRLVSDRAEQLEFEPGAVDLVRALAQSEQAWTTVRGLNGYAGAVDGLVEQGIVVRWEECPDGPAVTLTPLGAARLGLAVIERWERAEAIDPDTNRPYSGVIETPEWDDAGRAAYRPPLVAPKHAREVPLRGANAVPDPRTGLGSEYLTERMYDPETGEEVERVRELLGRPIKVDRRLGRRGR